jgi:NAD(P)-dependent dehydrogenase (short-subunit alcohol dehydrogenase family)
MRCLSDPIRLSQTLIADPSELVELVRSNGLEGRVAKRTDSVYEPGKRSGRWVNLRIINVSSVASIRWSPVPFFSDHTSKAGLNHMSRGDCAPVCAEDLRCNVTLLGMMDTPHIRTSAHPHLLFANCRPTESRKSCGNATHIARWRSKATRGRRRTRHYSSPPRNLSDIRRRI